ncbi:6-bladed beta-propeller [Rhodohalobacter sulfatireducens]|uniref:6-bladed beta-propeller n=1 Tax=Rhodohalobacter sulfatireducens TaxID=2911366 RepID=A0ABS9KBH2_9BACT|nr:6-bladed beta-propeller [Rhodohalobacter sulfatireducens]MCG2588214.1 6-bladed beta-propeller [Rhodohalobacter sulfatireducens]
MRFEFINSNKIWLLIPLVLFLGCQQVEDELPKHWRELENLTVYTPDDNPTLDIQFSRATSFGLSDEVLIGRIGGLAVADDGRIFIGDAAEFVVHVYSPDGSYVTSIGREGRGPGEFISPPNPVSVKSNRLYIHDVMQFRVSVYSTDTFELLRTIDLNVKNQEDIEELEGFYVKSIYFINDTKFLAAFGIQNPIPVKSSSELEERQITKYYLTDDEGRILPDKIFELCGIGITLTATVNGEFRALALPLAGHPMNLITFSRDVKQIYHSPSSQEFLIKVYEPGGRYVRAFYYPVKKRPFSRKDALRLIKAKVSTYQNLLGREVDEQVIDYWTSVVQNAPGSDFPVTWPILKSMRTLVENQLWVSTFTENLEEDQYWILDESGKLLARFLWPRDKLIALVKNGYLYTQETDTETGLPYITKYRIEMKELEM